MKIIAALITLCLCSACATKEKAPSPEKRTAVSGQGNAVSRKKMAQVRTEETVKAYPVGRYSDPDLPDVMHERHTVYRREQSPNWNYLPDEPYALPLGPTVARSNPSASYYVRTDAELMNARQRAQADALTEQNRALRKRITDMEKDKTADRAEVDQLKRQLAALPVPTPAPEATAADSSESSSQPWEEFSN
ncbi:MAG: hypothetical protein WA771_00840 [Chthoniobacterales bacterium]